MVVDHELLIGAEGASLVARSQRSARVPQKFGPLLDTYKTAVP